jgi:23S rRNA G2069 N7-methylase RlmK/C1962 C5-methylase RlmI
MLAGRARPSSNEAYTNMTKAATKVAVLTKRGTARARTGHPWIYRSDVAEIGAVAGDVVRVVDRGGCFLGWAFYNPDSEITLRIATREDEEVNEAFFRSASKKPKHTANPWT